MCLQGSPFCSLLTVFFEGHSFYPIDLIVAYQLNDKKSQLLATFQIVINDVFVSRSSLTKVFLGVLVFIVIGFIFFSNDTNFRPTSSLKLNFSTGFFKGLCCF